MSETVYTDPIYNDIEFEIEDSIAAWLAPIQEYTAPIYVSLATEEIDNAAYVAVICDDLDGEGLERNGNWQALVRIKVVTPFDETVPEGFANLRALHRQRCAVVRDRIMVVELADELSNTSITVQGFSFPAVKQQVINRSWVTEFHVKLKRVSGNDLTP